MPTEPPSSDCPRVLVVDDLAENRDIFRRKLERLGYQVVEAEDGEAALAAVEEQTFDLVLLDWMMPGMEGPEVLQRIREAHTPGQLPVIMVTARSASQDVSGTLGAGANDYVTKPVDFAVLQARMQTQLARKTAEDVTYRTLKDMRRTVGELENARRRAEAGAKAKSEFLANISHEIRTPLNGVLGMAEVMALDELTEAQRQRLEVIRSAGEGLLSLFDDILDTTRIESGKVELETVEFDLETTIAAACAPYAALARDKGLELAVEVAPEARGGWKTDPARLRQVLINLVSNAVKFTAAGRIDVEVTASGEGLETQLCIAVRDTGVGIEPEALERVFEKFAQADASATRDFGGAGLGLAISRDLARLLGGDLTAESKPGQGSTFRFRLSAHRLAGPINDKKRRKPKAGQGARPLRVLAAEDNPTNQLVLAALLEAAEVDLVLVPDGAQAVEAWRKDNFDIVLMDVQMPVMSGVEATEAIRGLEQERNQARTPIIAVTANALGHQLQSYMAAGMDSLVPKPIQADLLYSAIAAAISAAAARSRELSKAS